MALCPICYSQVTTDPNQIEYLKQQGIYVWTDDPLLTELGLAGEDYKGLTNIRWIHVKQIQDARKQQEIDLSVYPLTSFSNITSVTGIRKIHIEELRISTEKILTKLDEQDPTKTIDLHYYFNYCRDGSYFGTYEYGSKVTDKSEWTDVDRSTGNPSLPSNVKIRAIHIEDLRHQIPFEPTEPEPEWHTFEIYPKSFSYNKDCPPELPIKEQIYATFDGMDVSQEVSWTAPEGAYISYESWKVYIVFNSLPSTSGYLSATFYDYYGRFYYDTATVSIYGSIKWEGEMLPNPLPDWLSTIAKGNGIGCNGSAFSWTKSVDLVYPDWNGNTTESGYLKLTEYQDAWATGEGSPYPFIPYSSFSYGQLPRYGIWSGVGYVIDYGWVDTSYPHHINGYSISFNYSYKKEGTWWYELSEGTYYLRTSLTVVTINEWNAGAYKIY